MIYPWLRHLPLFSSQFLKSKSVGPMKMRQLQDDVVAEKQVQCQRKVFVSKLVG